MLDLDYEEMFNLAMQSIEHMLRDDPNEDTKLLAVMKKSFTA